MLSQGRATAKNSGVAFVALAEASQDTVAVVRLLSRDPAIRADTRR